MGNLECCASGADSNSVEDAIMNNTDISINVIMSHADKTQKKYEEFKQEQVFKQLVADKLTDKEKQNLFYSTSLIDPEKVNEMYDKLCSSKKEKPAPDANKITPLSSDCIVNTEDILDLSELTKAGNEQIKTGLVALLIMASEKSSEFGNEKSHGCAKDADSERSIFQVHVDKFL